MDIIRTNIFVSPNRLEQTFISPAWETSKIEKHLKELVSQLHVVMSFDGDKATLAGSLLINDCFKYNFLPFIGL